MDLQIDGIHYRTRKLSGIQQWELFRRLGPMVPILSQGVQNGANVLPGGRFLMGASFGALSDMKQADSDYLLAMCLGAVDRRTPDDRQYRRMVINDQFMFDDETPLVAMLELMEAVIEENLGSFFGRIRDVSAAEEATTTEPTPSDSPL
jgi:hypothetical protein